MYIKGGLGFQDKSADELLSFLAASNPEFDGSQFMYNNQDLLNNNNGFQNFGEGPDLSSVMFDGYTAMDDQHLHQQGSDNHH